MQVLIIGVVIVLATVLLSFILYAAKTAQKQKGKNSLSHMQNFPATAVDKQITSGIEPTYRITFLLSDGVTKTFSVPKSFYESIDLHEHALLLVQNGEFIDFGNRWGDYFLQ
ncbi:MAG: DUF2500 family protein [Oscillospiraceae bacterium]